MPPKKQKCKPTPSEPLSDEARAIREKTLHTLIVGRDCVDAELVALLVFADDEGCSGISRVAALFRDQPELGVYSSRTGLVKLKANGITPATPLSDHPNIEAVDRLLDRCVTCFAENGNAYVAYDQLEGIAGWEDEALSRLRGYISFPRLLASLSLFDHDFTGAQCRLSPHNYAVFGAYAALRRVVLPDKCDIEGPLHDDPTKVAPSLRSGTFHLLTDVVALSDWPLTFAPHLPEITKWAWETKGVELGIRVHSAKHAPCEVETRSVTKDVEFEAIQRVAMVLGSRPPPFRMHVAKLRKETEWKSFGQGGLRNFLKSRDDWFIVGTDYAQLKPDRAPAIHQWMASHPAPQPAATDDDEIPDELDEEDDDVKEGDKEKDTETKPCDGPLLPHRGGEACYHEVCFHSAMSRPTPPPGLLEESTRIISREAKQALVPVDDMVNLFRTLACDEEDLREREEVRRAVEGLASKARPGSRVYLFGTSANGSARKTSDVDLYWDIDGKGNSDITRAEVMHSLRELVPVLKEGAMEEVTEVFTARIPLVRGTIATRMVDVSVGTPCGIWNTQLIRQYIVPAPCYIRMLVVVIVEWSKGWKVNDSPNGFFSTYSILLLVIFFLQVKGEVPRIPIESVVEKMGTGGQYPDMHLSPECDGDRERLGELIHAFFRFYGSGFHGFHFHSWVVSVRCGAPLQREDLGGQWKIAPIAVEDPFETHLNTCRAINPRGARIIMSAFEETLQMLHNGCTLDELLGGKKG
eukprot:Sspe_Gene.97371::Locus_70976_Transcript_1_2_Confidence_0.500_Length_2964::g.97371::m.97371/K14079/PAPD4, GLD2; poly(A) RNA polymerase GLD2